MKSILTINIFSYNHFKGFTTDYYELTSSCKLPERSRNYQKISETVRKLQKI